jgi:hypothetical protein
MDRRRFLLRDVPTATLGAAAVWSSSFAAAASGDQAASPAYFEFYYIHMQNGSQTARLLKWLETGLLPVCQKHGFGPIGVFNVTVGANLPTTLMVYSYPSLAEMEAQWGRLGGDADYARSVADLEKDEPAFYRAEATLLRATSFCPPFAATPAGDSPHKLYELRIYESPTNRQLGYLHDRFGSAGEIEIFHKSGIHPVLYANTVFGPNQPNMAYLIPFESEAQREKAWATFGADPDWVKIREESIRHGGDIVRNITNMFLAPTGFSMLK